MGDYLWCVLGFVCAAFVAVKFIGGFWCLMELRRKWRSTPELWSIGWLDIVFRLEREFGVTLNAVEFEGLQTAERVELTAGQLWELIASKKNRLPALLCPPMAGSV
jgi:hypothetical protein